MNETGQGGCRGGACGCRVPRTPTRPKSSGTGRLRICHGCGGIHFPSYDVLRKLSPADWQELLAEYARNGRKPLSVDRTIAGLIAEALAAVATSSAGSESSAAD